MRQLSILFFAALMAATSARAVEERDLDLTAFDKAMQLYAKFYCLTPPPGSGPLWQVNVSVEALADENSVVKASGAGRKKCLWHKRNVSAPSVHWPYMSAIPVPAGDKRPVPLIAFDHGVRKLLDEGSRCSDDIRPAGYGQFRGIKFELQATIGKNGVVPRQRQWNQLG